MYQTAGSNMVKCIAQCMKKPLITKELNGIAIKQTLDYQATDNDEVEDLYQLLKDIQVPYQLPYPLSYLLSYRRDILRLKGSLVGRLSQVIKGFVLRMFVRDLD